jgi:hypothetical protein
MRVTSASILEKKSWAKVVNGSKPQPRLLVLIGNFRSFDDIRNAVMDELKDNIECYDLRTIRLHDEITVNSGKLFRGLALDLQYLTEDVIPDNSKFKNEPYEKTMKRIQKWNRLYGPKIEAENY